MIAASTPSQRISLTRIIAINWYGFRQIIDIVDDTLISGVFGSVNRLCWT